jgi:hypothetical protein
LDIAQRKSLLDINHILQKFNNKNGRKSRKFPEKSVDETTEEEFDVDAIMKDTSYNNNNNNNDPQFHNNPQFGAKRDRSSSSSKENHSRRKKTSGSGRPRKPVLDPVTADPDEMTPWSPYGYHPQLAELDDMFHRNPRAIKDIMEQLNPGEQFFLDLAGNVRKGPSTKNRNCYCAPVFAKFEKRLEKDKKELIRHIDKSNIQLDSKLAFLEKRTKEQLFGLNQAMKESFAAERGECLDRMDRRALRERIAIERQQVRLIPNDTLSLAFENSVFAFPTTECYYISRLCFEIARQFFLTQTSEDLLNQCI